MTNTELYINNKLADIGANFSVRLNRQLIKPGELNTKDAQYSYSISLPPTARNNAIFNYSNIEEVSSKFNRAYSAELIVNSVRIFKGNFRLSNISNGAFKGNLYVPAVKTIKDIFGNFNLNEIPEYRIPFTDFSTSISNINNAANNSTPMAIFPYVLYGLLPKVPLNKNANSYSPRDIWDDSVRLGMQDLPPSINPLLMLRHLFESQGYELQGTAFNDDRLTRLFMSYKNPTDYVQPWNYGAHAKIKISGAWSSTKNKRNGDISQFERGVNQSSGEGYQIYSTDLFDSTNSLINILNDPGGNVLLKKVNDSDNIEWLQTQIRIPASGFYKINFGASIKVYDNSNWRSTDNKTRIQHLSGKSDDSNNSIVNSFYEIKLIRDNGKSDFGLQNAKLDGTFYFNNQDQTNVFDETSVPKHFPQINSQGQLNFIDISQNKNHLLGFGFGSKPGDRSKSINYKNPRDTNNLLAQMQASKPALSWDTSEADTKAPRLAISSVGWWKYGRIGAFDNEDDNPNINIDFSEGTLVSGKILNNFGNPVDPEEGTTVNNIILSRFPLQRYFNYVLDAGGDYTGKAYIHAGSAEEPRISVDFINGIAEFSTAGFSSFGALPLLTIYLKTADFDVRNTLKINRRIEIDSEDVVDWEVTDKYKITLNNAPQNYVKRGQFNGVSAPSDWNGQGDLNAVVWLDAGELLTVASVSSEGRYRRSGMHSTYGLVNHEILFNLEITPFRVDEDWLKVAYNGNGISAMNWNDAPNFDTDSINLAAFLPSDMKANDFIDNFVKAFNLQLTQKDSNIFSLDVKQTKTAVTNRFIDLDEIASIKDKENTPLGLPSLYKLGFTINTDEEGYFETQDDGGGEYATGVIEGETVEQKSNFSYNWFKTITQGAKSLELPNISKHDVWELSTPYPEAMLKRFTDLSLRFWYFDGLLDGNFRFNNQPIYLAKVSNAIAGKSILNYKNQSKTILDNYFTLLINGSSHFTDAEAFLSPIQYQSFDGSLMARFNGDLYYVAEISGYDPAGRNKSKISLIRKI